MEEKQLIAFILYLQTWLKEDEDIEDLSDEDLKELTLKWKNECLPMIESKHSGDCVKQPWSCMRCWFDRELAFAGRVLTVLYNVE